MAESNEIREVRKRAEEVVAPLVAAIGSTATPEQVEAAIDAAEAGERLAFPSGLVRARPAGGVTGLVATFTATDDLHEPHWEITGVVGREDNELVIAELTIRRCPGNTEGIRRPVMSAISVPALLRGVRRSLTEHARLVGIDHARGGVSDAYRNHADKVAAAAKRVGAVPEPGRKGHSEVLYQQLASRYLEIQEELEASGGTARGIVTRLTAEPWDVDRQRGLTELPRDTVKSRLRKCDALGFLTFAGGGRAGAVPGPRYFEDIEEET